MQNISGIIKIEFVQHDYIVSVRINPETSIIEKISPKAFGELYGIDFWIPFYFTPLTAELQINTPLSDAGTIYECIIRARVPKDRPEPATFIRTSQDCWFLLKVTDANGITRLIGTPDFPARFAANPSIPASPAEYNGYDISFTSRQLTPPAYFV